MRVKRPQLWLELHLKEWRPLRRGHRRGSDLWHDVPGRSLGKPAWLEHPRDAARERFTPMWLNFSKVFQLERQAMIHRAPRGACHARARRRGAQGGARLSDAGRGGAGAEGPRGTQ